MKLDEILVYLKWIDENIWRFWFKFMILFSIKNWKWKNPRSIAWMLNELPRTPSFSAIHKFLADLSNKSFQFNVCTVRFDTWESGINPTCWTYTRDTRIVQIFSSSWANPRASTEPRYFFECRKTRLFDIFKTTGSLELDQKAEEMERSMRKRYKKSVIWSSRRCEFASPITVESPYLFLRRL